MRTTGFSRREDLLVAAFLAAAFSVSIWQVRGSMFCDSAGVQCRCRLGRRLAPAGRAAPARAATLKMARAWLVSLNVAWSAGGVASVVAAPAEPALSD